MLKDFLKKSTTKKESDKVGSVLDGYVDIKIYDCKDKDNKKLVYHDTGDNTVTIWMKHVILQLLAGYSSFSKGENLYSSEKSSGSCLSFSEEEGQLFFDDGKNYTIGKENVFSLLPTKVLLGTGKEYTNWESLTSENKEKNAKWYQNMLAIYGDDGGAFKDGLANQSNDYSASISTQGNYSLTSTFIPNSVINSISVEDPDGNKLNTMPSDLSRRIGVVGAIKTPYTYSNNKITRDDLDNNFLNQAVSDSGRLLQPKFRGIGKPCFLYFKRKPVGTDKINSIYDSTNSVYVNRESLSDVVCNKITFTVILPAQTTNSEYYPYNGYTLKQIGLFNDAIMSDSDTSSSETQSLISKIGNNLMPHGTLLAVKDIAPFTKTSTSEVKLTWTLTI